MALGKTAAQSTTRANIGKQPRAKYAVDGYTDDPDEMSRTFSMSNQWWRVDLGEIYFIKNITLYTSADSASM